MENVGVKEMLSRTQEAITVEKVYGAPVEHDGTIVIPAAAVRGGGGGGGGGGSDPEGATGEGGGGGFGVNARPAGALVFREGEVLWKPAIDVTRMFALGTLVAIAYLFFDWRIEKAKAKAARRR